MSCFFCKLYEKWRKTKLVSYQKFLFGNKILFYLFLFVFASLTRSVHVSVLAWLISCKPQFFTWTAETSHFLQSSLFMFGCFTRQRTLWGNTNTTTNLAKRLKIKNNLFVIHWSFDLKRTNHQIFTVSCRIGRKIIYFFICSVKSFLRK